MNEQTTRDIRLVVSDMDGTLLDANGRVPDGFWPFLDEMTERGIAFVPASGRQCQSLARLFDRFPGPLSYVGDNGGVVMHADAVLHSVTMDPGFVRRVVLAVREANDNGSQLRTILCRVDGARIDSADPEFDVQARTYCAVLEKVDDLAVDTDGVVKIAIYDFADASVTASEVLAPLGESHKMVVSGAHWIDITDNAVHKGVGVRRIQDQLGVIPDQTVVFGDYLNDLEMLDAAHWSFAMANAHPEVAARARYGAPSNADHGVVSVLRELLE
ncbi:Cof-type HAD-IIB family hydrolase [Gordonia zhaorongruii]|uniref:Cof-type HAD-IIB family hydrolase n=1 Tax=Gordonia zhaorongruii TaxID=2597659 RepID=UPI001F207BB3|nr:Cof-type HAD-IIB family hydrolase [Gordonia zhaorongruii]